MATQTPPVDTEVLLEEMQRRAVAAPEPEGLETGEVVSRGETPQVALKATSAGYVILYHTETFEPSRINRNQFRAHLQRRLPNGKLAFTADKPAQAPRRGHVPCWLHASTPERQLYDSLGLATCRKAELRNEFQAERHMIKTHSQEYATIKARLEKLEKEEDRAFQRQMLGAMAPKPENELEACEYCGKEFRAVSVPQAKNKVRLHQRKCAEALAALGGD